MSDDELRAAIIELYDQGCQRKEIAKRLQTSHRRCAELLKEIPVRPQGEQWDTGEGDTPEFWFLVYLRRAQVKFRRHFLKRAETWGMETLSAREMGMHHGTRGMDRAEKCQPEME